jgi:hypothetical protein
MPWRLHERIAADEIVHDHHGSILHVPDQGVPADHVLAAVRLDEGRRHVMAEPLGERRPVEPRAFHAAGIRRDHDQVLVGHLAGDYVGEERSCVDVLGAAAEGVLERGKAMDFDRGHAVYADGLEKLGHVPGNHRVPRLGLALLPRVAEIGNDGRDARRVGVAQRTQEEQQPAQLVVDAVRGVAVERFDDVDVAPAHAGERSGSVLAPPRTRALVRHELRGPGGPPRARRADVRT